MRKIASLLIIAFTITAILFVFQPTAAQNNILTVPDEFLTITQAIQNATDGDTIFIKQGIYNETIVIDKQLTIKGEDTNRTIINGNCSETVILIQHDCVTITGLTIQYGAPTNSPRTYWVHNFPEGYFSVFEGWDSLYYPLDSGFFTRYGEWRLAGIHILGAYYCSITGNRILDCGLGVWLYKSANNQIVGNEFARNDYAVMLDKSARNNFTGNTFRDGGASFWIGCKRTYHEGIITNPGVTDNVFSQNNFISNQKPFENQFLVTTDNVWDNGKKGNYWNDYNGTDSNQDGIADQPREVIGEYYTGAWARKGAWVNKTCGQDNYPLIAPFDTSSMFVVYRLSKEEDSKQMATNLTIIEIVIAVIAVPTIVRWMVHKKEKQTIAQTPNGDC